MKLVYLLLASVALAADTGLGCYSLVDTSNFEGEGQFETSDTCSKKCENFPYIAIKNGGMCYCLSSRPSSNQVSDSQCSTPCNGYGDVKCGGSNAFTVFKGLGEDSGSSAGSLPLSSSSGPLSSSTALFSSSTDGLTAVGAMRTSLQSQSSSTHSSSVTTTSFSSSSSATHSDSAATRTVTQSSHPSSSSSSTSSASLEPENTQRALSTNVGAIAGGVVGGVVGLICIAIAIFFFIRHRRKNDESDDEEFFEKGSGSGLSRGNGTAKSKKYNSAFDMPMANPFSDEFADKRASKMTTNGLADPRLNPAIVGRRRLSDGSLADETDYSRKILAVANP